MSLSVEARHCGAVYVVRCTGRIVAGEEVAVLETAIQRGLREFVRIVLHTGEVTRVDSTGMGLLVRFLSHTRNRGGDFRLAAPPQFLTSLLQLTKLAAIFRIYDSEEEAIVSFLKEPRGANPGDASVGPMVLFVTSLPTFARLCARCCIIMDMRCCPPAACTMPGCCSLRPSSTTSSWGRTIPSSPLTMW